MALRNRRRNVNKLSWVEYMLLHANTRLRSSKTQRVNKPKKVILSLKSTSEYYFHTYFDAIALN